MLGGSCSQLHRAYGWKPAGTVPDPLASRREDYEKFFKPNYDPDAWAYCKCISDTDAKNLSTSLAKAVIAIHNGDAILPLRPRQTVIGDNLSVDDMTRINLPDEVLVSKFVEFTAQGGFAFAWDD